MNVTPHHAPHARPRMRLGGLDIDVVTFEGAIDAIAELVAARHGGMVFTPNIDHVVLVDEDPRLRAAYAEVSLSLVDGVPLLWASRLLGTPLPEKVSGSDLCLPLLERAAKQGWRVYLLGGAPGVAERAAERLRATIAGIDIVGTDGPRVDVDREGTYDDIVGKIVAARPDLLLVAFGCPKQEIFMHRIRAAIAPTVAVGVGAGIDFLAGTVKRAPKWISTVGLEWLYRLAREPRRLWRRYLVRDPKFVFVLLHQLRERRRTR